MTGSKIPVAVIGVNAEKRHMLDALKGLDKVEIVGFSGKDKNLMETIGKETGIQHFLDHRQMMLKVSPAVVFISSIPPSDIAKVIKFCVTKEIAVWTEAPLAMNLKKAVAYVRMFEFAGLPLAVGSSRRFMDSYIKAKVLRGKLGDIYLSRGHYVYDWAGPLEWKGKKDVSACGALVSPGYHLVDTLIWLIGLPESVYGVVTSCHYDTDDIASATWRYRDDSMATFSTSRITGPCSEGVVLCGGSGSISVDEGKCIYRNSAGDLLEDLQEAVGPVELFRRQAEDFVLAVDENRQRYISPAFEGLLVHSLIESIYLSSQTDQPENPLRQLQIHGFEYEECLQHSILDEEDE